jgi:hypothetical protein
VGLIKELVLSSRLKNKSKKPSAFVPWDKAKTLALVVDAKTAANKSLIDKFIYESDKVVDVFYLDLQVKESEVKNFISFTKADKNAFGLPNKTAMQKLSKKYDILIQSAFQEPEYATVLSNAISAACKVSYTNRANVFNLIIECQKDQDLQAYLKEVVNYLKMIRN